LDAAPVGLAYVFSTVSSRFSGPTIDYHERNTTT
jgi:hypothetical protein